MNLKKYGKWALITGASAGIGKEFARQLAKRKINCVIVARRVNRLEKLKEKYEKKYKVKIIPVECDLSNENCIDYITQKTQDLEIGILVNNAGFGQAGEFAIQDIKKNIDMIKVNCIAPVIITDYFAKYMIKRRKGAIINVSSVAGFVPTPFFAVYGATKAFDLMFSEATAAEFKARGVDVLTLCPYVTKTEFMKATGFKSDEEEFYKNSDSPKFVVKYALDRLGKKVTVTPPSGKFAPLIARLLPRSLALKLAYLVGKKGSEKRRK